ncbi:MAG TPA: hypothetical protein VFH06_04605 [Candidatus Saccharimonadales bacterium]|nr:hypothetical protein [Candidatus Saccharimonadales bacterium]
MAERMTKFVGYDFGDAHELPEHLETKEIFKTESWRMAMEVLRGSFVISSGRQYAQLCDMAVAAALIDEQDIPFDQTIFTAPEATEAIRAWKLAPSHTGKPNHTPGLVSGGHEFWWRMFGDAFAWRTEGAELLPNERAIVKRFRECGVGRGTSSTTTEELAALDKAVDDLRGAQHETSEQLAMRSLQWHLKASLHWLTHIRPRTDREDKSKDEWHSAKHEDRWRTGMITALETPEAGRTLYDKVLVKEAEALDILLEMSPEMLAQYDLEETRELYDEVLELYNQVHGEQLTALHSNERRQTSSRTTSALGVLGLSITEQHNGLYQAASDSV